MASGKISMCIKFEKYLKHRHKILTETLLHNFYEADFFQNETIFVFKHGLDFIFYNQNYSHTKCFSLFCFSVK